MRRLIALALLLLAAGPGPAWAHRGHASLSVVEIDAATGAVTVTHRLEAHDVEPALAQIAPAAQQNLDDPEAIHALEAYAGRVFQLWDADGKPVALAHTRTDLRGDDIELVYAGRLAPGVKAVTVDSGLMELAYPDQENQVNVRRNKVTRTALFRPGDEQQRIAFD